jgi:DNA mismatch endonuclease (patch repair protein)
MSKIKSKGSKIELKLKKALENEGVEFEYQPKMFGRPDYLVKPNVAVFCDSSFWHGRNWKELSTKLPSKYWHEHIKGNIERDKIVTTRLKAENYVVLRFWDDHIEKNIDRCVRKIVKCMNKTRGAVPN